MSQVALALPGAVGFYGKIPAEPDFVRVNAGAFLRAGLDRWFQEGVEHLQCARLPAEPTCFLLSLATDATPFVGVFAPGEDTLGRAFPVVVFAELEQSPPADLSLLPLRLASFCAAGARLAMTAHALATDQVAAEIGALEPVSRLAPRRPGGCGPRLLRRSSLEYVEYSASSLLAAAAPRSTGARSGVLKQALASDIRPAVPTLDSLLVRSSCVDLCAALGGSCEAAAYALATIVAACAQARQADSPARVLVLDCPAPTDELRTFWLELVRRRLDAQMPSFFWTRESGRLLIALGPAPSLMLAYLADPDHKGSRRWPLCTHVARGNAGEKLSLPQRHVLAAGDASLADVLHLF